MSARNGLSTLAVTKSAMTREGHDSRAPSNEDTRQLFHQELYRLWQEVREAQDHDHGINITEVATWLVRAEQALKADGLTRRTWSLSCSPMYCLMHARYAFAKAQQAATWAIWGYVAVSIELLYLLAVSLGLWHVHASTPAVAPAMAEALVHVPLSIFVWGFLGGVSWCIYGATSWSKLRLFDKHYFAWYLAHPWLSALLGAAVSLLIIGGLASLGADAQVASPARAALLALVSFFAGFNTNRIWKLLDRSARKLLGEDAPSAHPALLRGSGDEAGEPHAVATLHTR